MKKSKATEALRVATDIAAIKATLHQRGYQLRKQPKQPVWKVIITPDLQKWKHVLWVHIQGIGGYFISYRQLEQWVAACSTLIRACRDSKALKLIWSAIEREATRYTQEAFNRLSQIHAQRQAYLHRHTTG